MGCCAHRLEQGLPLSWRLFQSPDDFPPELPLFTSWYFPFPIQLMLDDFDDTETDENLTLEFRFLLPLYHPNIYTDGRVCISILHPPGEDEMSGELAAERWSPAQRVESVLISILSLLDDAEVSSPANVDAAVMLRQDPDEYRVRVKANVEASKAMTPPDFKMPDQEITRVELDKDDADFWADSEVDSDPFGGSDSEGDSDMDQLTASEDDADEDDEDEDEKSL